MQTTLSFLTKVHYKNAMDGLKTVKGPCPSEGLPGQTNQTAIIPNATPVDGVVMPQRSGA